MRDGQLKATRIGKQYRVSRDDLEAFTGRPVQSDAPEIVRRQRAVEVSSSVQIDAIDADAASGMTNHLLAASKNHPHDDVPLRIDTMYDEQRGRLRVIITGSIAATSYLLLLVSLRLEQR